MCGLTGVLDPRRDLRPDDLERVVAGMASCLAHRGPDSAGTWVDADAGLALGHRRLAVLDLSPTGAQPMPSSDDRYVLAYNGEVYDFRAVRAELEAAGASFRGSSDTEVLLEAFRCWGVPRTLQRVNGMFALALWDRQERTLTLARDPLGEKPLYYGPAGRGLVFGSELKALRAHPHFRPEVDRGSLALLLRLSYVPAPWTVYAGVRKLPAGTYLTVAADGTPGEPVPFWSLREVAERGLADPFAGSDREAVDETERLLRDSVRLRMESDVPLGAFLSGGVDSSTVVALAQAASSRPVRTFTVSLGSGPDDEGPAARAVAAHLGTDHTEAVITPEAGLELVPRLPALYDEPFADPSQLPTALVCAEARRHVTVCLSGDGGDEVFWGYNRYVLGRAAWSRAARVPPGLRRPVSRGLLAVPPHRWDALAAVAGRVLPPARVHAPGTKLHKLAGLLGAADATEVHRLLVSAWDDPPVLRGHEHPSAATMPAWVPGDGDVAARMAYLDGVSTLPDEMLVKVDRASMAASLEVRVPLLDPRLVAWSWRLPPALKIRDGSGKWVLRQVLDRYVPRALTERPKLGFDPPVAAWLRGPLRPWAEDLLAEDRLRREGWFDVGPVRQAWGEHLAGRRNHDYALWAVLVAQQWLEEAA